jgi:hypothetical protein
MDKFTKLNEGKTKSQGNINMDEIRTHLSLPGTDKETSRRFK